MGNAWEIGSHTFSIKWMVFSIRLLSCCILYHMGNAWVFLSIFQGMGNSRKTHRMGKAWKMDFWENSTKPIVCGEPGKLALSNFSHSVGVFFNKILWYTFMWNTWVSPPISNSMVKCSKIYQIGRAWEIDTFFPWCMDTFLLSDSHLMQQNPSCELSSCFSTVLLFLFLLVPKSIVSFKEKTEKTGKVNSFF